MAARHRSPGRIDYTLLSAARRMAEVYLRVQAGEVVTVVADVERSALSSALEQALVQIGARPTMLLLEDLGERPLARLPAAVAEALHRSQVSVYMARDDSSEIDLRLELVRRAVEHGLRHAHMPGITRAAMSTGLATDPRRIKHTARAIRRILRDGASLHVRSAAGTDLRVRFPAGTRWHEQNGVIEPGGWSNLPAGSLFAESADVSGAYAVTASMTNLYGRHFGLLARTPVLFHFEASRTERFECDDPKIVKLVTRFIEAGHAVRAVGVVGFGTNVDMFRPIGHPSVDETLPGLHLGLGRSLAELTANMHNENPQLVLTAAHLDIDVGDLPLMRNGRYFLR
jgi:aminopeptidase